MTDKFSKDKRSKVMAAIRSRDTSPELALRKAIWASGLRFRKFYGTKKIDIAFPTKKLAIFIDGCFWHGCPIHSHIPKSNQDYWIPKLEKNKKRDILTNLELESNGWVVLRFWEHELKEKENIDRVTNKIISIVAQLPD